MLMRYFCSDYDSVFLDFYSHICSVHFANLRSFSYNRTFGWKAGYYISFGFCSSRSNRNPGFFRLYGRPWNNHGNDRRLHNRFHFLCTYNVVDTKAFWGQTDNSDNFYGDRAFGMLFVWNDLVYGCLYA